MPWRSRPRALFFAMCCNVALVASFAVLTVTGLQASCDRRADTRSDNRAMWVWLTDEFPGDDLARRARVELDQRLPPLACGGFLDITATPTEAP